MLALRLLLCYGLSNLFKIGITMSPQSLAALSLRPGSIFLSAATPGGLCRNLAGYLRNFLQLTVLTLNFPLRLSGTEAAQTGCPPASFTTLGAYNWLFLSPLTFNAE